jgi:hypothetical protein
VSQDKISLESIAQTLETAALLRGRFEGAGEAYRLIMSASLEQAQQGAPLCAEVLLNVAGAIQAKRKVLLERLSQVGEALR